MRSLVHQHVSRAYMTPTTVNVTNESSFSGSSVVVTPDQVPVAGNVMFIFVGGTQHRTVTPPAGWTQVSRVSVGTATSALLYKVATGSEASSYTVTFSGSITGGGRCFIELSDIDTTISPSVIGGDSAGAVTSLNIGNYNVLAPGVVFSLVAKSAAGTWNASAGTKIGASGEFSISRRIYAAVTLGESITWSGPSETVSVDHYVFTAKYVR